MSNLPPGVTEGMIPGNRPEDEAEEAFWDQFATRAINEAAIRDETPGLSSIEKLDRLLENPDVYRLLVLAREMGFGLGMTMGRAEAELERAERPLLDPDA